PSHLAPAHPGHLPDVVAVLVIIAAGRIDVHVPRVDPHADGLARLDHLLHESPAAVLDPRPAGAVDHVRALDDAGAKLRRIGDHLSDGGVVAALDEPVVDHLLHGARSLLGHAVLLGDV